MSEKRKRVPDDNGDVPPNIFEFVVKIKSTKSAIKFCRENGLLKKSDSCHKCGSTMRVEHVKTSVSSDKEIFRCCRKECRHTQSIRGGSIFKVRFDFVLLLYQQFYFLYVQPLFNIHAILEQQNTPHHAVASCLHVCT